MPRSRYPVSALRSLRGSSLAAALLLASAAPCAAADAPAVWSGRAASPAAFRLERTAEGWTVRGSGGERAALAGLPADARIESFREGASGWLATAIVPRAGRDELALWTGDARGARALPSPRIDGSRHRENALLLTRRGAVAAVAWLEGDDRRHDALRVAGWTGSEWTEPETVSPPGRGSQVALDAVELEDGGSLLVWAAFDGVADQILFARCDGARCAAPARIGDATRAPNITPAIAAVPGGALAVWSRRDGREYRLYAARWSGERWSEPRPIAGPGSLYPALDATATGVDLLYRDARAGGWVLAEADGEGRITRRAEVTGVASDSRPRIESITAAGVGFALGDRTVAAAWR